MKLINDYGELRCPKCNTIIRCNDCGDMPDVCPMCGDVIDYTDYVRIDDDLVSDAGARFLKEHIPNVSLMEAVMSLYHHKNRNKNISFTIQFTDGSGRTVTMSKSWNKVLKEWNYGIGEINCPGLESNEHSFIGNLASIDGISFGGNVPGYIVYKNLI